jgi:hypothetical protein
MRLAALSSLAALAFVLSLPARVAAQGEATSAPRIADIGPYKRAVPGEILELLVEGFGERFIAPPEDGSLRIELTQDGSTLTAAARTASPVFIRETRFAPGAPPPPTDSPLAGMKAFLGVTFVVPRGLHAGEAEVAVSYRGRRSEPVKFNILERPQTPVVGSTGVMTISPSSLPTRARPGEVATRSALGLKFERGAKHVEMHVRPLVDPEDSDSAVLVRFKQGGTFYETQARVVHHDRRTEPLPNGGTRFMPARDAFEVDVPELLAPGEAEIELRLRAAGQTGEAVLVPVTITDAERAYEAPKEAAPRMLVVTPRRVGAGQPVMISVDRRRALDPDPSKAVVVFETPDGASSIQVRPDKNSAVLKPDTPPDAPVLLIARAPQQITGTARVRLLNPARADYEGGSSEPAEVEVVADAIAPELLGVAESTATDLARLRQMYDDAARAGRRFYAYEPGARYVTIRARGLDYDPRFLRVRMEQEGRPAVTLAPGDFSLFSDDSLIVRVPKELGAGAVRLTVENRGASGYSPPVVRTFELSAKGN